MRELQLIGDCSKRTFFNSFHVQKQSCIVGIKAPVFDIQILDRGKADFHFCNLFFEYFESGASLVFIVEKQKAIASMDISGKSCLLEKQVMPKSNVKDRRNITESRRQDLLGPFIRNDEDFAAAFPEQFPRVPFMISYICLTKK